jgi:hypothetical protein
MPEQEKTKKTKQSLAIRMDYSVEKSEQQRTTEKKKIFLKECRKALGIVKIGCDAANIDVTCVYRWQKEDPAFRAELSEIRYNQMYEVEDRLIKAIANEEGWAIAFYLGRVHPRYRPKQEATIVPTGRTLIEQIKEYQNEKLKRLNGDTGNGDDGQPGMDTGALQDQGQEGTATAVLVQPSATILLGAPDAPEFDTEGTPEGNQ